MEIEIGSYWKLRPWSYGTTMYKFVKVIKVDNEVFFDCSPTQIGWRVEHMKVADFLLCYEPIGRLEKLVLFGEV